MISDCQFPLFDLVPNHNAAVSGGEASGAPAGREPGSSPDGLTVIPARGGVARTARSSSQPREAEIFAVARPIIVKEIIALSDAPDARAFARYLGKLSFSDLCARRDQLLVEKQQQAKADELRREPELPARPLRQQKLSLRSATDL